MSSPFPPGPKMSAWNHWCESLTTIGGLMQFLVFMMVLGVIIDHYDKALGTTITHDSFVALIAIAGARKALEKPQSPEPDSQQPQQSKE